MNTRLVDLLLDTRLEVFNEDRDTAVGSLWEGWNIVPDFLPAFLPGVCFSTQMAAACIVASRIHCVCMAVSQSAALMWSW